MISSDFNIKSFSNKNSGAKLDYQPNFVLVSNKGSFFGDIIPVYKSYSELSTVIVSSIDSLSRLVLLSRVFIICTVSLLQELLHNVAFQAFILLSSAYQQASALPGKYNYIKNKILETTTLFYSSESRFLWWIDIKLEIKKVLTIVKNIVSQLYTILAKFYLGSLVGVVLFIISFSANLSPSSSISNVLNKALNNYSANTASSLNYKDVSSLSVVSLLRQEAKKGNSLLFDKIIQYKVQPGDTPELVAEMYGLSPETVIFNNEIKDSAKLPDTLYLPWADGYIYKAPADTKPEDLERIYGVDKTLVYSNNEDLLNRDTGAFPKDSLILIPTTNFTSVASSNQKETDRIDNLKRAEEQKKAQAAISNSGTETYSGSFSSNIQVSNLGLIWPTSGVISRCIQPNHIACDIASTPVGSKPPIYAAQAGVVSAVYRFSVPGYGLAVVIDHGNGIKTLYGHMSRIEDGIVPGVTLLQGQSIGIMGDTGWATGVHLHFEVMINGVKQNPSPYLP